MKIAKAIVSKEPSIREIGVHVFAPHAVDQYFAVGQFQVRYLRRFRNDDDVIDGAGAVEKAPSLLWRKMRFD